MKNFLILFFFASMFILISCKKDKSDVFELSRSTFVGNWNVSGTSEKYLQDSLVFSSDLSSKLNLREDGIAIRENLIFTSIDTFKWFLQLEPSKFILLPYGQSFTPLTEFNVSQLNDENKQILHGQYETLFGGGAFDFVDETWILTR